MKNEAGRKQQFRFIASGIVTLFLIIIVIAALNMIFSGSQYWLWGIPVVTVSVLDIYFLTRSLLREPKKIDMRISTFIISIGATFGFSLVAISVGDLSLEIPYKELLQQLGRWLAIVPYPFVVWSLFCLKDCLTVVPEAHDIIANGIYQYSRHPLYVCYIVWAIANMMMFPTVSMMIGGLGQILFLVLRLRLEEKLLLATFPEYRQYYKRTGLFGKV